MDDLGYPGVRLRLTKKGAEHLKDVAVKLLNEQLASLSGFHVSSPFSAAGLSGTIQLNQIRTLRYTPPTGAHISFHPNTFMVLSIENVGVRYASIWRLLTIYKVQLRWAISWLGWSFPSPRIRARRSKRVDRLPSGQF